MERDRDGAIVLTQGKYASIHAKTAHGLVRGPSRWPLVAIVDAAAAGRDAGDLLDGRHRAIPVCGSVGEALQTAPGRVRYCVIGVATKGGVLPPELRRDVLDAAAAGLSIVNGLHQPIGDDEEIVRLARAHGAEILDIRRPRPVRELRFWTGEVLSLPAPRVAVLGTDCALGKRTTCNLLERELAARGRRAEVIWTGQTGWLQGREHGFMLDATPNDFVPGELERAILDAWRAGAPDLFLLEGQSGLRNPSGPCGSELILSAGARGIVLQHAPGRRYYKGFESLGYAMPQLDEEIALLGAFGAAVWAVALNEEGVTRDEARRARARLESELGIPVALPLDEGVGRIADRIAERLAEPDRGSRRPAPA